MLERIRLSDEIIYVNSRIYYRPQRSWAKAMFLQASVILSTGGGSASVHAGIPPPGADPPGADTPLGADPPGAEPLGADTPLGADPLGADPPGKQTPAYGEWAAGTHPSGMHSCLVWDQQNHWIKTGVFFHKNVNIKMTTRVFSKCTRMTILPILASEALFRENKKNQLQKCYPSEYWTTGPLISSPTCSSLH